MKVKEVFNFSGFPNPLATDEEKNRDDYGLSMAKAIEHEWFFRPESGSCSYYDKRDKYHNLRLYARGEQSTKIYKDLIAGGEDSSYTNYDWRPIQVIPKYLNLLVNQMSERLFNVKAEAIDKFSTNLKEDHKILLEDFIMAKPALQQGGAILGVDVMPDNTSEFPDTIEEVDLYMKLKYKPAIEIACEEAIKYTLDLNDYEETQSRVIEDIATIGLGAIRHRTDVNQGIKVEYVDPANMVHGYPTNPDFKDVGYYGEVKRISITELKRRSGNRFTNEELKDIAAATPDWSRYHGFSSNQEDYEGDDIMGMMVDVLDFTFKSVNTINYKKKKLKNGGFKMVSKDSDFDGEGEDFSTVKKTIDVWYEGSLVLGTNEIFNYKLCENMVRPNGNLNITSPNYLLYAPEMYQNRTRSLVGRIIPYVDQMQQIHIKIQQMIAKARPNGIFIDVEGLEEVDLGDGNFLSPLENLKMYDESGNILGASKNYEGAYNNGKETIKELKNGVVDGLDRLIGAYNHYQSLVGEAIGIPKGVDASTPHPDTLVGVQQQTALNSNTATRHVLDSILNITQRLGGGLVLRIKDIFEYSDLKEAYINAVGKINVKTLEPLKKYALHDLGILIELKPDVEEKQYLEQNISIALNRDTITLDDAIDIRNIPNVKLANELLKTRRLAREKKKAENEKAMIAANGEAQAKASQAAAQAKQAEIQATTQAQLLVVQAKSEAKNQELEKEAEVKAGLMKQEFEYNMMLKGVDVSQLQQSKAQDSNDKMVRQKDQQEFTSKMQDKKDGKPVSFESSEDNISGNVELGELEPQ